MGWSFMVFFFGIYVPLFFCMMKMGMYWEYDGNYWFTNHMIAGLSANPVYPPNKTAVKFACAENDDPLNPQLEHSFFSDKPPVCKWFRSSLWNELSTSLNPVANCLLAIESWDKILQPSGAAWVSTSSRWMESRSLSCRKRWSVQWSPGLKSPTYCSYIMP